MTERLNTCAVVFPAYDTIAKEIIHNAYEMYYKAAKNPC